MKCGIDLVFIPDFEKRAQRGGERFLKRIFLEGELENRETDHLAGVFAAKEAVLKTLGLPAGSWKRIEVVYEKNGRPKTKVSGQEIQGGDLSISHAGNYAVAVFIENRKKLTRQVLLG